MNTLQATRKEMNETQNDVARGIGISYSMYVKMELGIKSPSMETMKKTAKYFGKSVDELFFTESAH